MTVKYLFEKKTIKKKTFQKSFKLFFSKIKYYT